MTSTLLKFQHSSLQFSDSEKQQRHDIEKLFTEGHGFPIKSGTEAGADARKHNMNRYILQEVAKRENHRIAFGRDNWIAVDRDIIKPHSVITGQVFVADNDETVGPGHDSVFVTFGFQHREPGVGFINLASCHFPTKGKRPGDPNYHINVRYSQKLGRWVRQAAKGTDLGFVMGDYNRPDTKTKDWLIGEQHLTSAPDELRGPWKGTGHGPIDGHMSYDKDGRVSAKWVRVLNDKKFFLNTDHFVVRTAFTVKHLPIKK